MNDTQRKNVYIIGAGLTGLSAAWKLSETGKYNIEIFEAADCPGGMSATFKENCYSLDYGPHKIFTVLDDVFAEVKTLFSNGEMLTIPKKSRIRLEGEFLDYPVGIKDLFLKIGLFTGFLCGASYLYTQLKSLIIPSPDKSYEDYIKNRFGSVIYNLVFASYARKIWAEPDTLDVMVAKRRVVIPNLLEMFKQMILKQKSDKIISADEFYYPKDGIGFLSDKMLEIILKNGGKIHYNHRLTRVEAENAKLKKLIFANKNEIVLNEQDILINTSLLSEFISNISSVTENTLKSAEKLKFNDLILFFIALNKKRVTDDNWLFFPEEKYPFNRLFEQKGFSAYMIPQNETVLCVELTCSSTKDKIWNYTDKELKDLVVPHLEECGLISVSEIKNVFSRRLKNTYPIYETGYTENLNSSLAFLDNLNNTFSIGRLGLFNYVGMMDSIDMGFRTSEFIINEKKHSEWPAFRERFYNYVVID